jgi:hypothetical protein
LPIVCANKFGRECDQVEFCGMSLIVSGTGEVLAKAPADQPALLVARVRVGERRLVLPEATIQRLMDVRAPVVPPMDAKPVRVAVLGVQLAGLTAEEVSGRLAGRGVTVVLRPTKVEGELATRPYRREASLLQSIGDTRVGTVTTGQARSFVWPRILALDGAQILCVTGTDADLPTLRTRAVENRVFVAAAPRGEVTVIGPSGEVIARGSAGDRGLLVVDLAVGEAGNKLVAPQTDIWAERRVGAYRLTAGDGRGTTDKPRYVATRPDEGK